VIDRGEEKIGKAKNYIYFFSNVRLETQKKPYFYLSSGHMSILESGNTTI
jgi:hypothetical protein